MPEHSVDKHRNLPANERDVRLAGYIFAVKPVSSGPSSAKAGAEGELRFRILRSDGRHVPRTPFPRKMISHSPIVASKHYRFRRELSGFSSWPGFVIREHGPIRAMVGRAGIWIVSVENSGRHSPDRHTTTTPLRTMRGSANQTREQARRHHAVTR